MIERERERMRTSWTINYRRPSQTYLCNLVVNDLLLNKIALVAYEKLVDTFICVAVDFLQPLLHIIECVLICDVIDHNDAVCSAVIRRGDGAKAFLPRSVPLVVRRWMRQSGVWLVDCSHTHTHNTYRYIERERDDHGRVRLWKTYNLQLHRLAFEFDRSDFLCGESKTSNDTMKERQKKGKAQAVSVQSANNNNR